MLFCKEVKKDFTVCLSGECADEIFAGYPWYHKKEVLFDDVFPWAQMCIRDRNDTLFEP